MGEAGNREKGKGYHARRIWHGPDETCWHVWLEAPPTHQFRKAPCTAGPRYRQTTKSAPDERSRRIEQAMSAWLRRSYRVTWGLVEP